MQRPHDVTLTPGPFPESRSGESVRELIAASGIDPSEARALLAFVLQAPLESLIAHPQRAVPPVQAARFAELCARRRRGEPVAYLRAEREFYGRVFRVDPAVLIPRPETECLVEAALQALRDLPQPSVIDLGTGSGCIAITLALERPDADVWATDTSEAALALARGNAAALGARVRFLHGHWYAGAGRRFDLIVSNPPYVAADDPHLADLEFEPLQALTDGADGLGCLRAIIAQAPAHLSARGALLVEHGWNQGAAVRALMTQIGLGQASTLTDLAGLERACLARSG